MSRPDRKPAKRYRVQAALQDHGGTMKPHSLVETNDIDAALDELERLLDHEPDTSLITFICRPLRTPKASQSQPTKE